MVFYRKDMNDNYDINIKKTNSSDSIISTINIMLNKSNFDNYKRTYKRLQSLLAEVMSVIGLLFEIGRIISDILCDKKMSKDIIYKILNKIENEEINQEKNNINTNTHEENKKNFSSERKNIKNNFSLEKKNIQNNFMNNTLNDLETEYNNKQKTTSTNIIKIEKNMKINRNFEVLKDLNYFHIIKSYLFCFKDKKSKLINLCHNIVKEDISIENILIRLYNLENKCYSELKKEKLNNKNNEKFKEINEYIFQIKNKDILNNQI